MTFHAPIDAASAAPIAGPLPFTPRLLSAELAALYLGVSKNYFLDRVSEHMLPQPARIGRRALWDRHSLDEYVDALFGVEDDAAAKEGNFFGD